MEVLATANRRKSNKRNTEQKEEVKFSLFADGRMLYTENSKDSIRKFLELISDLEKLQDTKSLAFLYTKNKKIRKSN